MSFNPSRNFDGSAFRSFRSYQGSGSSVASQSSFSPSSSWKVGCVAEFTSQSTGNVHLWPSLNSSDAVPFSFASDVI